MSELAQQQKKEQPKPAPAPAQAPATQPASQPSSLMPSFLRNLFGGWSEKNESHTLKGDQTRDPKTYSNFHGTGKSGSTTLTDPNAPVDPNAKPAETPKVSVPKVSQPDLSVLDLNKGSTDYNPADPSKPKDPTNGVYRESRSGTKVKPWEWTGTGKSDKDGTSVEFGGASATAGVSEKVGVRGQVGTDDEKGTALAKGKLYAVGEGGADAKVTIGSKGAEANANVGGKLGVAAEGDADVAKKFKYGPGESDTTSIGAGVHADGFVGVKAGAGIKAGIGPDYTGIEANAGAMAGAEGNIDVHANLGPIKGKLGASGIIGAGAEAGGALVYKDGKLTVAWKAGAAYGLGGSLSGEVTVDFKEAAKLASAAGKQLYNAADADKDGKLTLNDGATHLGNAAKGGANMVDKGWNGVKNMLDRDGDGKFNAGKDWGAFKDQVGDAVGGAKDRVLATGKDLLDKGKTALDRDGDGKLGLGDVVAGGSQLKDAAMDKINGAKDWAVDKGKKAHDFLDADKDGHVGFNDIGTHLGNAGSSILNTGKNIGSFIANKAGDAKDWAVDKAKAAGSAIHSAADQDGDGKIGFGDAKALGTKVWDKVTDAGSNLKQMATDKIKDVHDTLDLSGDGKLDRQDIIAAGGKVAQLANTAKNKAVDTFNATVAAGKATYDKAKAKVAETAHAAHDAADLDGDGNLGWNDVKTGAGKAADWASDKAHQAGEAIHNAADRDGDGKVGWSDVGAGVSQAGGFIADKAGAAKDAVVGGAKNLYNSAADELSKAGATLSNGIHDAGETVKGTWGSVKNFFGW